MKVIVQRIIKSDILIDEITKKNINKGLMILVGMTYDDNIDDIKYLVNKIINLRIFEENNKMNLSVKDIDGDLLVVPNFTLYANCKNGNRPSFNDVLDYDKANDLFNKFKEEFSKTNLKIEYGVFGSDMKINLINDGPVTIIIDSKER